MRIAGDPWRFVRAAGVRTMLGGIGLVARVLFVGIREADFFRRAVPVADWLLDIRPRIRTAGEDSLPDAGPVIFACNHLTIFDPVYVIHELYLATGGRLRCGQIMRDDFFRVGWINRSLARCCNTIPFPRGGLTRKNLTHILASIRVHLPRGVVLFASGTRSRTGEILDVFRREGRGPARDAERKTPARFLELLLQGLRTPVRVVPTTITYDFSSQEVYIVFGEGVDFDGRERPATLNARVESVLRAIESQLVIGPQHLLAWVLHDTEAETAGRRELSLTGVRGLLQRVAKRVEERYPHVQPELRQDFVRSFDRAFRWYRDRGSLLVRGDHVAPAEGSGDPLSRGGFLRKAQPSLFFWNQVKHLTPLREAFRECRLATGRGDPPLG